MVTAELKNNEQRKKTMKRLWLGIVIVMSVICVFALSSCGTNKIKNEEQAVKTYTCPADNMFGLEKVAVFEDSMVAVFDKELSYDETRTKLPAYANLSNLSTSGTSGSNFEIKNGKTFVTITFKYDEANKLDPDKDIEVTGFSVLGMQVTLNDGDIELYYSVEGGECFDDYYQTYSQSSGKWRETEHELVLWPMTLEE